MQVFMKRRMMRLVVSEMFFSATVLPLYSQAIYRTREGVTLFTTVMKTELAKETP